MIELLDSSRLFIDKLTNREYISKNLYDNILEKNKSIIPKDFDINFYNEKVINEEYLKYKNYFENMYKGIDDNICLDEEQIKAILTDEDYSLIIAGAGTGKTTTMAAKVKYLVDIKNIDPSKIVVMSYTKKATEELEKRIVIDFGIPAKVITFHALGLMHIREIFKDRKCYVVDDNKKEEIFFKYFEDKIFPNKNKVKEIINLFNSTNTNKDWLFGKYFKENYTKYTNFQEYFTNYKKKKILEIKDQKKWIEERKEKALNAEVIRTLKGEIVKSKGEALIANFLFEHGIDYEYEKIYDEFLSFNKIYKPDFTLNIGGNNIYIEYFGLSTYKDNELNRYEKIKNLKEEYHRIHKTKFIKIDYQKGENILQTLNSELLKLGIIYKPKDNITIIKTILDNNKISQFYPFKDFILEVINSIKSSSKRQNYIDIAKEYLLKINSHERNMGIRQLSYINDFYKYYQHQLFGSENYGFDFSDMLYYANLYIDKIGKNNDLNFEYIIIDEYQDISEERYNLTKNIAKRNTAKVVAVGDDWQSIFSFAGSKIEYIYNFLKFFPKAKLLQISNTYRNSQELINYSGKFIMKNKDQIAKQLVSNKTLPQPIKFVLFNNLEEYKKLKELIIYIHKNNPKHNILVLGRTNKIIDRCYNDPELKDDIGTKITFIGYEEIDINGMTIHKSKGLTADEVIVMGLDNTFPRNNTGIFWLENLLKNKSLGEAIPFAEERRLFYVALTRTKNYVYLLVNSNPKYRSSFINEIYNIIKESDAKPKN